MVQVSNNENCIKITFAEFYYLSRFEGSIYNRKYGVSIKYVDLKIKMLNGYMVSNQENKEQYLYINIDANEENVTINCIADDKATNAISGYNKSTGKMNEYNLGHV